jgi:hypothetical protein
VQWRVLPTAGQWNFESAGLGITSLGSVGQDELDDPWFVNLPEILLANSTAPQWDLYPEDGQGEAAPYAIGFWHSLPSSDGYPVVVGLGIQWYTCSTAIAEGENDSF